MTYAVSAALQSSIYQTLTNRTSLTDLVGDAIFDAVPTGAVPSLYVALGPEKVRDASDATGAGTLHEVAVTVVTDTAGFALAKIVAGHVTDALVDTDLTLARGTVSYLRFHRATAQRAGTGDTRRIDLIFRARVCDTGAPLN